jgi:uncharacterized protein
MLPAARTIRRHVPTLPIADQPVASANWRLALAAALAVLVFTRVRGQLACYVDLHRLLRDAGVPDSIRALDGSLLLALIAVVAATMARRPRQPWSVLGVAASLPRGLAFAALAGLPMLLQGWLGRTDVRFDLTILRGVVVAPLVEELFFRGALVGIAVRCGGLRFWPTAIAAGLLFGSIHVPWDGSFHPGHLGVFAATTAGGIWYAWAWRCHGFNLWTTIFLHAAMNAAWTVFAVADNAAGGLWPNVGRGLTIVVGTVLSRRAAARATVPGSAAATPASPIAPQP